METILAVLGAVALIVAFRWTLWRYAGNGKRLSNRELDEFNRRWRAEAEAKTPEQKRQEQIDHEEWLKQYGPQKYGSGTAADPDGSSTLRIRRPRA